MQQLQTARVEFENLRKEKSLLDGRLAETERGMEAWHAQMCTEMQNRLAGKYKELLAEFSAPVDSGKLTVAVFALPFHIKFHSVFNDLVNLANIPYAIFIQNLCETSWGC